MSDTNNNVKGGSYVPPHKRGQHQQEQKQPGTPAGATPPCSGGGQQQQQHQHLKKHGSKISSSGSGDEGGRHTPPPSRRGGGGRGGRGGGGGCGGGRGGRHHHHSNDNRNKHHHSNNNNNNHGPQQHAQHAQHAQLHLHQHHHYHHHDKEQEKHHKEQVRLFQSVLTRICCINLERRPDRWESFEQHLQQSLGRKAGHSLIVHKIEKFQAIDGMPTTNESTASEKETEEKNSNAETESNEDEEETTNTSSSSSGGGEKWKEWVNTTWDASENAKWDRHITPPMKKEMTAGEVGCALSHIQLWRELVETATAAATEPSVASLSLHHHQDQSSSNNKGGIINNKNNINHNKNNTPELIVDEKAGAVQIDIKQPTTMLILEDDALFYSPRMAHVVVDQHGANVIQNHDFWTAFELAWTQLPDDWDIWYLGFSDRGDRLPVDGELVFQKPKPHHHHHHHHGNKAGGDHHHHPQDDPAAHSTEPTMSIEIFRPTYGFHTHAYVLTAKAAQELLQHLPVQGPLDVWLADNHWFGLRVYCSVIANEGWENTGAWLVTQNRKQLMTKAPTSNNNNNSNNNNDNNSTPAKKNNSKYSDIGQSGRKKKDNATTTTTDSAAVNATENEET